MVYLYEITRWDLQCITTKGPYECKILILTPTNVISVIPQGETDKEF